jgi:hypothetical protein
VAPFSAVAATVKVAGVPTSTVCGAGWRVIVGGTFTVRTAGALTTFPVGLKTVTV